MKFHTDTRGREQREELGMAGDGDARCEKTVTREELLAKMTGKPDFVLEDHYCTGVGAYCMDDDLCVQQGASARLPTRMGTFTL
jgi:hypothetical protein